jgi:multiple sugar transport system substrate-binding protein
LTELLPASGYSEDEYHTVYRATHDSEGHKRGAPFNMVASCWVYNVDIFEEAGVEPPSAGWDWGELLDKARLLTDPAENQWGVHAWNNWMFGYFPFMAAHGAGFTNEGFTKATFNTPEAVDALQWMIDLIHVEGVAPAAETAAAMLPPTVADVFATGQVAMAPSGTAFNSLARVVGDRFRYTVIEPPKSPWSGRSAAYRGMEPLMLAKDVVDRGHVGAAVKFVLFLIGDEFQAHLARPLNRVTIPVNKRVARGEVGPYLEPPPAGMENVAKILEADYAYDDPVFARHTEFTKALSTPIDRAFRDEIAAAEALVEAEEGCNRILASV